MGKNIRTFFRLGLLIAGTGVFLSLSFSPRQGRAADAAPTESQDSPTTESQPTPENKSWWKKNFSYTGELRQETAYRFRDPANFSKIREWAQLELKFKFNEHLKLKVGGRAWYDAVYDLTDQYPPDVVSNQRAQVTPRDVYLDIGAKNLNIRLGNQQIVWGEALGNFFADVINPKDFREFTLPSFEDIRIQIAALDVQWNFAEGAMLEGVLTPDMRVDTLALPGADFAFFIPPPPPGVQQNLLHDDKPDTNFKDWNGGARVSFLKNGWDLAWLFYTGPALEPTLFKTLGADPVTGVTTLTLIPEHHRVEHYGMTFSKGIKSDILRGEFVFTTNKFFNAQNVALNNGVVQRNQLRYVIGFDSSLGGKVDMNAEFQQAVIFGNTANVADPILQSWIFLRFETGFFKEKLVPSIYFDVGLNNGDFEISPRISYKPADSVTLQWGLDFFNGPPNTLYGEFTAKSRVYMNTIWKF